ncbi:uncharacterized protein LOC121372869 [Gigantopelta aegis]|uniref:uncharacterized protein LOC121372869 n=1 Tax=Gigantopelta aegis TaxID=1735272 RepID=UPI001B88E49C|nr:uncharacterized protein LOC121372869 [Gigantopelta aegis]
MKTFITLVVLCGLADPVCSDCYDVTSCYESFKHLRPRDSWPIQKLLPETIVKYDLCQDIIQITLCLNLGCFKYGMENAEMVDSVKNGFNFCGKLMTLTSKCSDETQCYSAYAMFLDKQPMDAKILPKTHIRNHTLCDSVLSVVHCVTNGCFELHADKREMVSKAWHYCSYEDAAEMRHTDVDNGGLRDKYMPAKSSNAAGIIASGVSVLLAVMASILQ